MSKYLKELAAIELLPLNERIRAMIELNEAQIAENVEWLKGRGWTDAEIEQGKRDEKTTYSTAGWFNGSPPTDDDMEELWQDALVVDQAQSEYTDRRA